MPSTRPHIEMESTVRPTVSQETTQTVLQGTAQAAWQGTAQAAWQGTTQAVLQGTTQSILQETTQTVWQGTTPVAFQNFSTLTNSTVTEYEDDYGLEIFNYILKVSIVVCVLGILGNGIILKIMVAPPFNNMAHCIFCIVLAIVDFLKLSYNLAYAIAFVFFGVDLTTVSRPTCKLDHGLSVLLSQLDAYLLVCLTVDRVICVFKPLTVSTIITKPRVWAVSISLIIFFLLWNVEVMVRRDLFWDAETEFWYCMEVNDYGLPIFGKTKDKITEFTIGIIPICIMTPCNIAILVKLFKRQRNIFPTFSGQSIPAAAQQQSIDPASGKRGIPIATDPQSTPGRQQQNVDAIHGQQTIDPGPLQQNIVPAPQEQNIVPAPKHQKSHHAPIQLSVEPAPPEQNIPSVSHRNRIHPAQGATSNATGPGNDMVKMTVMIISVTIAYILLVSPLSIYILINGMQIGIWMLVFLSLENLSIALNFYLYFMTGSLFRGKVFQWLGCRRGHNPQAAYSAEGSGNREVSAEPGTSGQSNLRRVSKSHGQSMVENTQIPAISS